MGTRKDLLQQYYRVKDLSNLTGVSPSFITQEIRKGHIQGVKRLGPAILVSASSALEWLGSHLTDYEFEGVDAIKEPMVVKGKQVVQGDTGRKSRDHASKGD